MYMMSLRCLISVLFSGQVGTVSKTAEISEVQMRLGAVSINVIEALEGMRSLRRDVKV